LMVSSRCGRAAALDVSRQGCRAARRPAARGRIEAEAKVLFFDDIGTVPGWIERQVRRALSEQLDARHASDRCAHIVETGHIDRASARTRSITVRRSSADGARCRFDLHAREPRVVDLEPGFALMARINAPALTGSHF